MSKTVNAITQVMDAFKNRTKNEVWFNFVVSWIVWNGDFLLKIMFYKQDTLKQQAFDTFSRTDFLVTTGFPFLIGIIAVFLHPVINIGVAWVKNKWIVPELIRQQQEPVREEARQKNETLKITHQFDDIEEKLNSYIERKADLDDREKQLNIRADSIEALDKKQKMENAKTFYLFERKLSSVNLYLIDSVELSIDAKIIDAKKGQQINNYIDEETHYFFETYKKYLKDTIDATILENAHKQAYSRDNLNLFPRDNLDKNLPKKLFQY